MTENLQEKTTAENVEVAAITTPIWEAAINKDWNTVKECLQRDPSLINVTGKDEGYEMSLLHLAVGQESDLELVEYLVSLGADVNAQFNVRKPDTDNEGEVRGYFTSPMPPPLHFAVMQDNPSVDVLKFLISQGADINATGDSGLTPLHCAAMYGFRVKILKCLISLGADVHAKDQCGDTPLHLAAQWNFNTDVLEYLIAKDADMNAKNNADMTPYDVANTAEKKMCILREAGRRGLPNRRTAHPMSSPPELHVHVHIHTGNPVDPSPDIPLSQWGRGRR